MKDKLPVAPAGEANAHTTHNTHAIRRNTDWLISVIPPLGPPGDTPCGRAA